MKDLNKILAFINKNNLKMSCYLEQFIEDIKQNKVPKNLELIESHGYLEEYIDMTPIYKNEKVMNVLILNKNYYEAFLTYVKINNQFALIL